LKNPTKLLRARLYPISGVPHPIEIPTRINTSTLDRYPLIEGFLDHPTIQPYVHNRVATVLQGRHRINYAIFFKNHVSLPLNHCFAQNESCLRGDLVVMRVGAQAQFINFRGRDASLADLVIQQ